MTLRAQLPMYTNPPPTSINQLSPNFHITLTMSVPAAPTIPARKQAFLTAQTNLLSQPLVVSRNWRSANTASNTPLPPRLVDDALFNLNHAVQQHCRRVYAPQASRNVAEQISRSYTKDAERRAGDPVHGTVGRQADLGGCILRLFWGIGV